MQRKFLLAAVALLVGLLSLPAIVRAANPLEAQFRGCETEGWCRFWIQALDPLGEKLYLVRPCGIARAPGGDDKFGALRDRLNALLSSMIHQHKHIELHDPRALDDGTFAARVTVNGVNLACEPGT